MDSSTYHPLILAFEETYRKSFPLILVIGREPNTSSICDKTLGHYDFRLHPRCAFWNTTFNVFGRFIGQSTSELKQKFIQRRSSPIVFTDALSSGIKNEVFDKLSLREKVTETEFNQQVEDIFAHKEIINRTKLIILSGLSNEKVYGKFKMAVLKRAEILSIEVQEVPFFYPTNSKDIYDNLANNKAQLLKDVYRDFAFIEN